jgi:hypothetical protein
LGGNIDQVDESVSCISNAGPQRYRLLSTNLEHWQRPSNISPGYIRSQARIYESQALWETIGYINRSKGLVAIVG